MSLLALIGKGALVTLGAGAIVTPIAIKLSSDSYHKEPIVIEGFPDKGDIDGKCQVLGKDTDSNKYLLVCDFDRGSTDREGRETIPAVRFFSGSGTPITVDGFVHKGEVKDGKVEVTFKTSTSEMTQNSSNTDSISVSSSSAWVDVLLGVSGLQKCKFKGDRSDSKIPWVVECEGKGGEKKDIFLTPLSLK